MMLFFKSFCDKIRDQMFWFISLKDTILKLEKCASVNISYVFEQEVNEILNDLLEQK